MADCDCQHGQLAHVCDYCENEKDAGRYRVLRRKICIIGGAESAEFRIINLRPVYISPRPDIELDAVLDAVMAQESN